MKLYKIDLCTGATFATKTIQKKEINKLSWNALLPRYTLVPCK